jgi:hypothetical protein
MKTKKEYIWSFYAFLIVVLAVIGFYVGKKNNSEVYASGGVLAGAVISIVLWEAWGKKNSL